MTDRKGRQGRKAPAATPGDSAAVPGGTTLAAAAAERHEQAQDAGAAPSAPEAGPESGIRIAPEAARAAASTAGLARAGTDAGAGADRDTDPADAAGSEAGTDTETPEPAATAADDTAIRQPPAATLAPGAADAPRAQVNASPRATAATTAQARRPASGLALFLAALLGGAIAVALGFAVSHYNVLGLRAPTPPDRGEEIAALAGRVDGLAQELSKVAATAAAARDAASPAADGSERLAALAERVAALEARPGSEAAGAAAGPAAVDTEALRALIREEVEHRAATEEAEARDAAQAEAEAQARAAAIDTLRKALDSGAPYSTALEALAGSDIPETLARHAQTGLPTRAMLAASFPESARAALPAALAENAAEGGIAARIWAFLRIETGARALSPHEGDDPDAILSRAEALVKAGDLAAALDELAALPPAGRDALASWMTQAQDRLAAEAAFATLAPGASVNRTAP